MNNSTNYTSADHNRVVTNSSNNMSSTNNNTTRVFLRVKRRRPTSKTTFHDIANSTNNFINHTSATNDIVSTGPDRIQLTLPCISSSTNDDEHGGGGRNKKRRKMNELVKRMDSAVSLHDNNSNISGGGADLQQNLDFNNAAAASSLELGSSSANSSDSLVQTPASRRGASQNNNSSFNNNNKMPPQDKDPPFSNNLSTNNTNSTENNAEAMKDNTDDNIPAPPTKPKRTVTFRKITNLQKQLALVDPCNPDAGLTATGTERGKVNLQNKERERREENRDLLALSSNSASSSSWSVSNEDGEEKKSKWLRIVDVMLKEESDGSDDNNAVGAGDEDSSMCGGEGLKNSTGGKEGEIPKVIIKGSGQRINRMRPRPTDNEEEEKKCEDDNEDGTAANNSSGMRQKKRRKLSGKWVVEQTRNVLECDFTMESANTSSFGNHNSTSMCGSNNNSNTNRSMNSSNNHGLPPETIKLIDYSLQSINNQNTGSVSPHLAFLLHDPRLDGKGKLFVDYQLGSSEGCGGEEGMASGSIGGREEETEGKGRTILHMAALYGDLTSIRTLLTDFNANPTIQDSQGNTPSILARQGLNSMAYSISSPDSVARRNSYNVIEALIEGKVQSWKDKNQQQKTSISSTTTTAPATETQPPQQLDAQTVQLLNYSLSSIQKQNGGSIVHYLSFLKSDNRLAYNTNTERAKLIVNHTYLPSHELIPEVDVKNSSHLLGKGRTILHYAALYGDFIGVTTLLNDMGANPTMKDDDGNTPAMLGGYKAVVDVLKEGEKRWNASTKDGKDDDGEYYYEVYCLEETTEMNDTNDPTGKPKSQFLRPSSANSDSIPGLELSSALSEEEDEDNDTLSSRGGGGNKQDCALIELQQGFGYWNEKGELVLEGDPSNGKKKSGEAEDDDDRFVQKFYHNGDTMNGDDDSMGDEEEHDSNDEGYDGNDYPDDDDSDYMNDYNEDGYGGCYSDDDDSVDNWRLDFRNRYVSREALNQFDSGGDGDSY